MTTKAPDDSMNAPAGERRLPACGVGLSPAWALPSLLALLLFSCGRPPLLIEGPVEVTERPTTLPLAHAVQQATGPWEFCFEFDRPGDSHQAAGIDVELTAPSGARLRLASAALDRRGEAIVCLVGPAAAPAAPGAPAGETFTAATLTSKAPLRIRSLRGGPAP